VKQMVLIVGGLIAAVVVLIVSLPQDVGVVQALKIAGSTGRMRTFDFTFDLTNQYTFWSGTIAALFLFCSYFGTDQSQVQRYLTARSVDEARESLLMSAYWKIPLQALVLLVGVFVFLFYLFTPPPLLFNRVHDRELRDGPRAGEFQQLESRFAAAAAARSAAGMAFAQADASGNAAAADTTVPVEGGVTASKLTAAIVVTAVNTGRINLFRARAWQGGWCNSYYGCDRRFVSVMLLRPCLRLSRKSTKGATLRSMKSRRSSARGAVRGLRRRNPPRRSTTRRSP